MDSGGLMISCDDHTIVDIARRVLSKARKTVEVRNGRDRLTGVMLGRKRHAHVPASRPFPISAFLLSRPSFAIVFPSSSVPKVHTAPHSRSWPSSSSYSFGTVTIETTIVDDHTTLSILANPITDRGQALVFVTDHVVVKVFIARL